MTRARVGPRRTVGDARIRQEGNVVLDAARLRPTHRPTAPTLVWRWRYETTLTVAVLAVLAGSWRAWGTAGAALLVGAALALVTTVGPLRRFTIRVAFRLATPHRVRAACDEARIHSRNGFPPAVLLTRTTAGGERVTLLLPTGTTTDDFHGALDLFRTACWARTVHVVGHPGRPHLVTLDIIRREDRQAVEPPRAAGPPRGARSSEVIRASATARGSEAPGIADPPAPIAPEVTRRRTRTRYAPATT